MAIHASPVEINLLKTAKLMTTFVVLTKNGKRTCRKLTMFRRMLATTPLELVRLFRPGMRLFFFCWPSLGPLASVLAPPYSPASMRAFMSWPGFSLAAAISSGPRDAPSFAGRLLTSVCTKGGMLAKFFSSVGPASRISLSMSS